MDLFKSLIGSCYSVNNFVLIFKTLGVDLPRYREGQRVICWQEVTAQIVPQVLSAAAN